MCIADTGKDFHWIEEDLSQDMGTLKFSLHCWK